MAPSGFESKAPRRIKPEMEWESQCWMDSVQSNDSSQILAWKNRCSWYRVS
jgi:hypothetical protein